jgi:hypothetical protein
MIIRLTCIFSLLVLIGCEKIKEYNQEVLFKVEYINYAWGFQHHGKIIDLYGNVISFNLPATWHFPDEDGYISLSDMSENMDQLGDIVCTVDNGVLADNFNKLLKAKDGELTDPEHRMYDAGSTTYSGFLYDSRKKRYKEILIRRTGDYYIENKSKEAGEIYNWLQRPCKTKGE